MLILVHRSGGICPTHLSPSLRCTVHIPVILPFVFVRAVEDLEGGEGDGEWIFFMSLPDGTFLGKNTPALSYLPIPYRGSGMIDHFVAPTNNL